MKKLFVIFLLTLLLTGCGVFERGNYDKERTGYVLSGDLIVSYHTNSVGEIDIFMIDQVFTYLTALEYVDFDIDSLHDESVVSVNELNSCGIEYSNPVPKYIRIEEKTYYFNVRDNGYCTFDEYKFYRLGVPEDDNPLAEPEDLSPIEDLNITVYKELDFNVNTFETIVFIEDLYYNTVSDEYDKEIVTVLPMSIKQAGNMFEDNTDFIEQITIMERYVLENQSINLLELKEGYEEPDVNVIWSDYTIDRLGRDHDIVKSVRIKKAGDILIIINDTLSRLGMFS